MEPRIVVEDVRGLPMRVYADRPRSLSQIADLVMGRPPRDFLVCGDRRLTDHELVEAARRVAANLASRGLQPGDRVAILGANSVEWALAFWGTVLAGGTVAALNGWWAADEIRWSIDHCTPRFLIGDRSRLERLSGAQPSVDGVFVMDARPDEVEGAESFDRLLASADPVGPVDCDEDDAVAIFYTSGTTGRPRGAVATHRSWIAALQSLQHLASLAPKPASESPRLPEVTLATLPLFHVSGCQSTLVAALAAGNPTVLLEGRFDAEHVLRLIDRERVTRWSAVPTMVSRVCRHPARDQFDLTSMRSISYGGSPAPPELPALIREAFPNVSAMGNAYGLTESGTIIAVNAGRDFEEKPDSVGRPFPVIEVRIGEGASPDAPGEILLRGPMVMPGYWNDPIATAEILDEEGWLHTGDVGHLDRDGFLYVTDRAKDMIIRGGENVYPAEIEQRLGEHPAVIEAAVLGAPDADLGEVVKAVVRLAPDASVTDDDLASFVGDALASFKIPVQWERTADPLPRNAAGKLLKDVLRSSDASRFVETL